MLMLCATLGMVVVAITISNQTILNNAVEVSAQGALLTYDRESANSSLTAATATNDATNAASYLLTINTAQLAPDPLTGTVPVPRLDSVSIVPSTFSDSEPYEDNGSCSMSPFAAQNGCLVITSVRTAAQANGVFSFLNPFSGQSQSSYQYQATGGAASAEAAQ
jgi:hypothetical protein